MSYKRSLALFVTCSLFLVAPNLFAGQVSGQLGMSLTIVKNCELSGEQDARGVTLGWNGCADAAFQLRDEQDRLLPAQHSLNSAAVRVESADLAGDRVVVYW